MSRVYFESHLDTSGLAPEVAEVAATLIQRVDVTGKTRPDIDADNADLDTLLQISRAYKAGLHWEVWRHVCHHEDDSVGACVVTWDRTV